MRLRRGVRGKGEKKAGRGTETIQADDQPAADLDTDGEVPVGSVLGLSTRVAAPVRSPNPGDEWGLYDPETCGYGALLASLEKAENRDAEPIDEDPAELLLKQQPRPLGLPAEELQPDLPGEGAEPRPSPAATAVAACRVGHFAPLALWVHADSGKPVLPVLGPHVTISRVVSRLSSKSGSHNGHNGSSDLADILGRLTVPAEVAATLKPEGCTIRQIRIAPVPELDDIDLLASDAGNEIDDLSVSEPDAMSAVETPAGVGYDERPLAEGVPVDSVPPADEAGRSAVDTLEEAAPPKDVEPKVAEPEVVPTAADSVTATRPSPPRTRRRVRVAMALG